MLGEEIVLPSRHVCSIMYRITIELSMYVCSFELCHVVDVPTFSPPSVLTLYYNKKLNYSLSQFVGLRFKTISIITCSV